MGQGPALSTLSVDVEDYFHAANIEKVAGPAKWHQLEKRVDYSTRKLLDVFDSAKTKGTFFVLGYVARRFPTLVKEISSRGHEIASHGYGHRIVYTQTERAFRRDLLKSKQLLEEITGIPVIGYRAPNFSITERTPWAYPALVELGFKYDSSVYPIWHPRYANRSKQRQPYFEQTSSGSIAVFPLAVAAVRLMGKELRVPVAGGAYWRLFPRPLITWGLDRIGQSDLLGKHCYLHPWEIDAGQPKFAELPLLTRIRHYGGISTLDRRLVFWMRRFSFTTFANAYAELIASSR
jgi:polysaccharide deacetylase family protein (PEP-CTERM system associated)